MNEPRLRPETFASVEGHCGQWSSSKPGDSAGDFTRCGSSRFIRGRSLGLVRQFVRTGRVASILLQDGQAVKCFEKSGLGRKRLLIVPAGGVEIAFD